MGGQAAHKQIFKQSKIVQYYKKINQLKNYDILRK